MSFANRFAMAFIERHPFLSTSAGRLLDMSNREQGALQHEVSSDLQTWNVAYGVAEFHYGRNRKPNQGGHICRGCPVSHNSYIVMDVQELIHEGSGSSIKHTLSHRSNMVKMQ